MNRTLRIITCAVLVSCVGIAVSLAAKPVDIPVTVTFRSGAAAAWDGVRGDGTIPPGSEGPGDCPGEITS